MEQPANSNGKTLPDGFKSKFGIAVDDFGKVRDIALSFNIADRQVIAKLVAGMSAIDVAHAEFISLASVEQVQSDFIQAMIQTFPQAAE